jgi:hypothetical protein
VDHCIIAFLCDVITFDFDPQLLKLLQNRTILLQDNLLIDVHNPLLPYTSPDGVQGEACPARCIRMRIVAL